MFRLGFLGGWVLFYFCFVLFVFFVIVVCFCFFCCFFVFLGGRGMCVVCDLGGGGYCCWVFLLIKKK